MVTFEKKQQFTSEKKFSFNFNLGAYSLKAGIFLKYQYV